MIQDVKLVKNNKVLSDLSQIIGKKKTTTKQPKKHQSHHSGSRVSAKGETINHSIQNSVILSQGTTYLNQKPPATKESYRAYSGFDHSNKKQMNTPQGMQAAQQMRSSSYSNTQVTTSMDFSKGGLTIASC